MHGQTLQTNIKRFKIEVLDNGLQRAKEQMRENNVFSVAACERMFPVCVSKPVVTANHYTPSPDKLDKQQASNTSRHRFQQKK